MIGTLKILIVDDDKLIIKHVSKLIDSLAFDYEFITKPEFIQRKLLSEEFDLILLDINMEGQNGLEVLKALKADEQFRSIPVIMITGESEEKMLASCFEAGAIDYIMKPIKATILKARVSSALERQFLIKQVNQKNIELSTRNENLNKQKTLTQEAINKLTSSMDYARKIQGIMLPSFDKIPSIKNRIYHIDKPRDIVSGDFYWSTECENGDVLVAIGDCTGHGVPGAFMSILGVNELNRIVKVEKETDPSKILYILHKEIRDKLKQENGENNDGMEIGICRINKVSNSITFSGAKMPLIQISDAGTHVIKTDRMAIGGHQYEKDRVFHNQEISIETDTMFFLSSDGYKDQFGGDRGRKFMNKSFIDLLSEISPLDLVTQRKVLIERLENWKNGYDQTDDIIVMGLRMKA